MRNLHRNSSTSARVLLWIARFASIAALIPVLLILIGEAGSGPASVREWIYLALFPIGFSLGYLLGWQWPLFGVFFSLGCMVLSLLVIGRILGFSPYLYWVILSVPGVLYVLAGWKLRNSSSAAVE
jgi:Kef-type K+ transport system membrane component KefB